MVSVIVPAYNAEEYITTCLYSIINQDYTNIEIIVVNDGSTDHTGEIVKKISEEDLRVKLISESNHGVTCARKIGVQRATGEYVCFVDADDFIDSCMITAMRSRIDGFDVVSVGVFEEYPDGTEHEFYDAYDEGIYQHDEYRKILESMIFDENTCKLHAVSPWIWNKLYKRELVEIIMGVMPNHLVFAEDTLFVCLYLLYAESIVIHKKSYYHYKFREKSVVHRVDNNILIKINETYNAFLELSQGYQQQYKLKYQFDEWLQSNVLRALYLKMNLDNKVSRTNYLPQLPFTVVNIYGAGDIGKWIYKYYTGLGIKVSCWVDKNYRYIEDRNVVAPDLLIHNDYPIVVAVGEIVIFNEIKDTLVKNGISSKRIFWAIKNMKLFFEEMI